MVYYSFTKRISTKLDCKTHLITTFAFLFCGLLLDAQIEVSPRLKSVSDYHISPKIAPLSTVKSTENI